MKLVLIILLSLPLVGDLTWVTITGLSFTKASAEFGIAWVFISPLWALALYSIGFASGRTIEVIETTKTAAKFATDNKHHVTNLLQRWNKTKQTKETF